MNASEVKTWQQDRGARFRIAVRGDEVHVLAYECDEGSDAKFDGVEVEVGSQDWDEAIRLAMVAFDTTRESARVTRDKAFALHDFHRCPNTNQVIASTKSDDKAICLCGKVNPDVPLEQPGIHVKSFLAGATHQDFLTQENSRMLRKTVR